MTEISAAHQAVQKLYNTYPFPPEPLLDQPPPGYNWRWNWTAAHNFCLGMPPRRQDIRILDAGCGTGVGTEYLIHLNPQAEILGVDISDQALAIAQERCERSGVKAQHQAPVNFKQLRLEEAATEIPGTFDYINCVGVLHHLPDPMAGIRALAPKLAPGGLMHIFVYGELGRWEIQLMQEAIALLQGDRRGDYTDGVEVGRSLFAHLPEHNRLVQREKERWSMENQRDECFADMYVHPQEKDYNIYSLFELIEESGLEFLGFSNPQVWDLQRLIPRAPHLIQRAETLSDRQRYRLIELLDPSSITHYEFFLGRPPLTPQTWDDDQQILTATAAINPCLDGWPSPCLFNPDYQIINLSDGEFRFLQNLADHPQTPVGELVKTTPLECDRLRHLQQQQVLMLIPATP